MKQLTGLQPQPCQMVGCDGPGVAVSACGIIYLCPDCQALIDQMTAKYLAPTPAADR